MKIMKLRQNAVKNPRQNAMEYGLQAKRNGVLEQNTHEVLKQTHEVLEAKRSEVLKAKSQRSEAITHSEVMAASIIPVSAKENLGDPIDIREELTALRFRADIAEAENASLRARIKTAEAIEKITRNRERQACVKIEQQLDAVQESQRQD
ncbi:hypothetical protein Tco_1530183 [Tanacetum coccineum]